MISWITDPVKPVNLVMLYIEEPDLLGHAFGTNSEVFKNIVHKLDNVTKYLQASNFEYCFYCINSSRYRVLMNLKFIAYLSNSYT